MQITVHQLSLIKASVLFIFLVVSTLGLAQHTLGLDKSGKVKRIHFYEGTRIKIKLDTKEKVSGHIDAIYDSSFVIEGRVIKLKEVAMVYSARPAVSYLGGAFVAAGLFYFGVDLINNAFNYGARGYLISDGVLVPVSISVGTGLVLMYFGTRRTQVQGQGNFRIYNTTPIPIKQDSTTLVVDSADCDGVQATLKKIQLDGCNWVLELPSGERLEPLNIHDFYDDSNYKDGEEISVLIDYQVTESASICMVGKTVTIRCLEIVK